MQYVRYLAFLTLISASYKPISGVSSALKALHPNLNPEIAYKVTESVEKASIRYDVDPYLLIAIAFQESSFRHNLEEGPAGERGICQVRKIWAFNPHFVKEFGTLEEEDFDSIENSFLFAAWILNNAQQTYISQKDLPTWTYYNAQAKKARQRYFFKISKHLMKLGKTLQSVID